ncbi:MAG: phosphonate C-P lyase system protein PhnH [Pseudaminobacter sp.]|nr:phosphonate C-P lyase system protein PhnH [Pseudaminobacter sp.]
MLESPSFGGGFADPLFQSQAAFRAVMDAMARPGSVHAVSCDALSPPAPLLPAAAAVALTLCDHDTAVWLDPPLAQAPGLADWLTFHTGAAITANPARAAFALIQLGARLDLDRFNLGTDEYPDRSTTLIVQVDGFSGGEAMMLSGPGILGLRPFAPRSLPADFVTRWAANNALFPRGVDLVLCSAAELAALPRSTRTTTQPAN